MIIAKRDLRLRAQLQSVAKNLRRKTARRQKSKRAVISFFIRMFIINNSVAILCAAISAVWFSAAANAATYASMVMDARNGEILYSRNANAVLHPASLTKMMTMYIAFEAVENGEVGVDDMVKISRRAAAEPASKLGLRAGSRIKFRYLLRAAAVRSANDAATAIAETISGSVESFTQRMNRTAKALGMIHTTFKNAHGLTQNGHQSSARDMTILGRHLIYDFEEYYNMYSRESTYAGLKSVNNTNRRLLSAYKGADGIKTGYTHAAGFNLVASAKRGDVRVIATVFGGRSSASRNKHVMELLDKGFAIAKKSVRLQRPALPVYGTNNSGTTRSSLDVSVVPIWRPMKFESSDIDADSSEDLLVEQGSISDEESLQAVSGNADKEEDKAEMVLGTVPIFRPKDTARNISADQTLINGNWHISIGEFPTSYLAERELIAAGLIVHRTMPGAEKTIEVTKYYFQPRFLNMTESQALTACRILTSRLFKCKVVAPNE